MWPRSALTLMLVLLMFQSTAAFEPVLLKERIGGDANFGTPCPLTGNTNGTAANYRWYNLCSGYIWIYRDWQNGEGVGVLFGGDEQPAVAEGNIVRRAITYYRNVAMDYCCAIQVSLERDNEGEGCPDGVLATELQCPGFRWNCAEFGLLIPPATPHIIVRQTKQSGIYCSRFSSTFATDGPFSEECSPDQEARSFYYASNGSCQPWIGPTGRNDNFLTWLIVDGEVPNAVSSKSWGSIKGLYR